MMDVLAMTHASFYYITLLSTLYCLSAIAYRLWFHPTRAIPGPFLARVSILWQLWHVCKGDYRNAIRYAHGKYGPLVRVTYEEVSVCNDEAVRKVLNPSLDKSNWYRIFAMPDSSFINQMSELKAKEFARVQKKIAKGYTLARILEHEKAIDEAIELFETQMENFAEDHDLGLISLGKWFTFFSFDLIGTFTFSQDFGFLKTGQDIGKCCATSEQLVGYLAIMSFFPHTHDLLQTLLGPILNYFDLQPMKHVMQTTVNAISRREKSLGSHNDMVSVWRSYSGPDPITDHEVLATANSNIAAAGDTTCVIMQAFVYHVLQHPHVKARLIDELQMAAATGKLSSPVQYRDTLNLPYFQWREALRIHPASPNGFPRIAPAEGIYINGKFLAPGTVLSVNAWALHHDQSLFGQNASEFRPDRWLNGDEAWLARNWIPFSAGYMTCPGRHLATVECFKLLATLFLDFEITLAYPDKEWTIRETILVKGQDWPVQMVRRGCTSSGKDGTAFS